MRAKGKGVWAKWVPLKVGLLDHVEAGKITANMLAVFTLLLLEAKRAKDTGIVWTSAAAIARKLRGLNAKGAQRALRSLIASGYLKSFARAGVHGSYPLGIERYMRVDSVQQGVQQPRYLNASATETWDRPVFEDVPVTVQDSVQHPVQQGVQQGVHPFNTDDPDPDPESTVQAPPEPAAPKAPTRDLIDHWRACRARDNLGPEKSGARHAAAFADLWGRCNRDTATATDAIARFFDCRDAFFVTNGHTLGDFQRTMDRWIREANGTAPAAGQSKTATLYRDAAAILERSRRAKPSDDTIPHELPA